MTQSITQGARTLGHFAAQELPRAAADLAADQAVNAATNLLFGPKRRVTSGPKLDELRLLRAGEGGGVPRVYGRSRVGGQIIWASELRESTTVERSSRGAKGFRRAAESESTAYSYTLSFAVALCEGILGRLGRAWADGRPIALSDFDHRIYHGTENQMPDPLIEAALGGEAPSYQGIAYVLFEDFPLGRFGNRVPQLNFEVECGVGEPDPDDMEQAIRAVTVIPGSGEAVLAQEAVFEELGEGMTRALNRHNGLGLTDAEASFDQLQGTLPNTEAVSLVVSWFGDDLRAEYCNVRPGTERPERVSEPDRWRVNGEARDAVHPISLTGGQPNYGGTPSDKSVAATLADLKARGLFTMFHPFILMDVPPGNALPDPYGGDEQAPFPWRGRITAEDGAAGTRQAVEAFFSSYSVMVRHYAAVCRDAGGVDAFLLGSELRGLTRLRDEEGRYPAAEKLIELAAEVKAILPGALVSYGADWTEYAGFQPPGANGDLLFPLDALWADGNVDFVGIDNYMPLSDWREGNHLDAEGAAGPYDRDYLMGGITGGEGHDWYYASEADRLAQIRTPITDGSHDEPWVFRTKDIRSWWMSTHHERIGGIRGPATPWVPQSKPVWFTELGCPAIDKGPNQPNVFVDPKSSESAPPHFSSGARDDRAPRALLEAHHAFWSDPANNPVSDAYGGPMVDPAKIFVYAWDARPYPDFPARSDVWADAGNWLTGHWLNGRAGRVPLGRLIEKVCRDAGLSAVDASACDRLVTGVLLPGPMTAREALEPLFDLFQLDAVTREGVLVVRPRSGETERSVDEGDLVDRPGEPPLRLDHAQFGELPSSVGVTFADELSGFELKTVEARDETAEEGAAARVSTAVVLEQGEALARGRSILAEARAMHLSAGFALPEAADGLEPSSVVGLTGEAGDLTFRITEIEDRGDAVRAFSAITTDPRVYAEEPVRLLADPEPLPVAHGGVVFEALDIPVHPEGEDGAHVWLAAFAEPWPGGVSVLRGGGEDAEPVLRIGRQSLMGRLSADLAPGPAGRWDRAAAIEVRLPAGSLSSVPKERVLEGAHLCAVRSGGGWEILQFAAAELLPGGRYRLTDLLRGRFGTEEEALAGAEAGARFVLLGQAEASPLAPERWGTVETLQAGPETAVPGSYPFRSNRVALTGTGARPLAPVHLRMTGSAGSHRLSWTRRTRVGGDAFGPGDVALGESEERYEITLRRADGSVILRDVTGAPHLLHGGESPASAEVRQLSRSFGPGRAVVRRF